MDPKGRVRWPTENVWMIKPITRPCGRGKLKRQRARGDWKGKGGRKVKKSVTKLSPNREGVASLGESGG